MNKGKTIFGILLGVVALAGGYYLYRRYKRSKEKEQDMAGIPTTTVSGLYSGSTTSSGTTTRNDNFPLAKGSRGELVKQLQNALMVLYPNSLPKFGADGIWGAETEAALKNNNQPTVINKADFDRIVVASRGGAISTTSTSTTPRQLPTQPPTPRGVFPE